MSDINAISDLIEGSQKYQKDDTVQDSAAGIESQDPGLDQSAEPEVDDQGTDLENEGTTDDAGDESIATITELARTLEVDPVDIYSLQVPMGDGIEPVTLSELKDTYKEMKHSGSTLEQEREALNREREALINEKAMLQQQAPIQNEALQAVQNELQQIEASYSSIDWEKFEAEDPGNAALQRQKFQDAYSNAAQKAEAVQQELVTKQKEAVEQQLQLQRAKVLQLIPEWADSNVAKVETAQLKDFIKGYGFDENEIGNITDARLVKFIYDAMKLKSKLDKPLPDKKQSRVVTLKPGTLRKPLNKDKAKAAIIARGKAVKNPRQKANAISELLNIE